MSSQTRITAYNNSDYDYNDIDNKEYISDYVECPGQFRILCSTH